MGSARSHKPLSFITCNAGQLIILGKYIERQSLGGVHVGPVCVEFDNAMEQCDVAMVR